MKRREEGEKEEDEETGHVLMELIQTGQEDILTSNLRNAAGR